MKTNLFETNPEKKLFPKYIFKRLPLTKELETFYYKIDYSSGYFLRRLYCKYPGLMKDPNITKWSIGAAVAPGAIMTPSAAWQLANPGADLLLQNTGIAGVTAAAEPVWPRTHNQVVIDNTVTWLTKSQYNIQAPRLNFAFFDNGHDLARQSLPVPADLIGSPAQENNYLIEAPQAADADLYGLNWNTPNPPTITASLNFLYKYGDVIKLEITGQQIIAGVTTGQMCPNFIDLFLLGYYLPTGTLENH